MGGTTWTQRTLIFKPQAPTSLMNSFHNPDLLFH
jgi:hypothetical protein